MRLDGFGLLVREMGRMIRFYRDVLRFEIKEAEDTSNVYLVKDGTLFLLYGAAMAFLLVLLPALPAFVPKHRDYYEP